MLAQNFKTPAELGITDAEFDALFKVLGMLEREEIPFASGLPVRLSKGEPGSPTGRPSPKFFNMTFVTAEHGCGTAGCIMGWAQELAQSRLFSQRPPALAELFWMGGLSSEREKLPISPERIQPSQAAIAVRNFLTHGVPRWAEALSPA